MKKLADATALGVLNRLEQCISDETITASQAWSVFSRPDDALKSKKKETKITASEHTSLTTLKSKVKELLKKKISGRCAYCKRVMGQHGMSWHIEHIRGKSKNPKYIFNMKNLTYACIDCNYMKSPSVDTPNISHLIINPNSDAFQYDTHIKFIHIATEKLHYLRYSPISDKGITTYEKLAFKRLELIEIVTSLNPIIKDITIQIDSRIDELDESDTALKNFLMNIKHSIS
ncbi:HNH endonuclease [Pseudomonas sp. ES1]|uniref:HNH endonuclease n=1 Tax=Pseudomonas sp. ES1 TaxID=3424775 RepID=UPI003D32B660